MRVAASALLALVAACGGGTSEPGPPPPPPAPGVVTTVEVSPPSGSLFVTDTLQLSATVKDQRGAVISGKTITWTSNQPAFATVDASGRAIGVAPGSVGISAEVEGKTGTAQLGVTGPVSTGGAPGSATLGPAGGSVSATLPGGGSLALTVPADALTESALVTLTPTVPAGSSQAAFQVTPAGLHLSHSATLVITVSHGAIVTPNSVLVFDQDGIPIPVPTTPDPAHHSVTISLSELGLPPSAAGAGPSALRAPGGSRLPHATAPGTGNLVNLTLDSMFIDAGKALVQLQQLGTGPAYDAMELSVLALFQEGGTAPTGPVLADPRAGPLFSGWRTTVCTFRTTAVNVLQSFNFVSDYAGLQRVSGGVITAATGADTMAAVLQQVQRAGCPTTLDANAVITAKLQALKPAIVADLNAFAVLPSPRDSVFEIDRLKPLLDLAAAFTQVAFDSASAIVSGLFPAQVDRIRAAGYTECRQQQPQGIQSRLVQNLSAGGPLAALASFSLSTVNTDIQVCGMSIAWKTQDSTGAQLSDGVLGGGNAPDTFTRTGSGIIVGSGSLVLGGPLNALRCPAPASANAEQFEVLAGATLSTLSRVAILTPANDNTYLEVSSLTIPASAIRTAAGIPPTADSSAKVVVHRIGGTCAGTFVNLTNDPLGTLDVHLALACGAGPSAPFTASRRAGLRLPGRPQRDCVGRTITGNVSAFNDADIAALSDVSRIEGNLSLGNGSTTDLHELALLREVTGLVSLTSFPNLTSLSGLSGMTLMGGFLVNFAPQLHAPLLPAGITDLPIELAFFNSAVNDLGGFQGLQHISSLAIENTPIASLAPLGQARVDALFADRTVLTTLTGPQYPAVMKDLFLGNNPTLTDASALSVVTDLTGSLNLGFPSAAPFAGLRTIGGGLSVGAAGPSGLIVFPALTSVGSLAINAAGTCPSGGHSNSIQLPVLTSVGAGGFTSQGGSSLSCPIDVSMANATIGGPFLLIAGGIRTMALKTVVNSPTVNINEVLTIQGAQTLTSISFTQPIAADGLLINSNPLLHTVSGLSGSVRHNMIVTNNPLLSTAAINGWPISVPGTKTVTGNAQP